MLQDADGMDFAVHVVNALYGACPITPQSIKTPQEIYGVNVKILLLNALFIR